MTTLTRWKLGAAAALGLSALGWWLVLAVSPAGLTPWRLALVPALLSTLGMIFVTNDAVMSDPRDEARAP